MKLKTKNINMVVSVFNYELDSMVCDSKKKIVDFA